MNDILTYFFESYFHLDWRSEWPNSIRVVEAFKKDETMQMTFKLLEEFRSLVQRPDLPQSTISEYGGCFNPETEGMNIKEWLLEAIETLESDLKDE